jgi:hypothetical protein
VGVAGSVEELLADFGAGRRVRREPFVPAETRSTTTFERVWVDGDPFVLKHLHLDGDFTMRVSGDIGCRAVRAYAAGLLDVARDSIDHAIVGAATGLGRNGWGGAFLMRDVSPWLASADDSPFVEAQHVAFVDSLAALCAATWGWRDERVEFLPYGARWAYFGAAAIEGERALGWPERVPAIADEGWERFGERAPAGLAAIIGELRQDPSLLVDALRTTPSCRLHGDWKASNLGTAADGRTILLDWMYVGEGPACHELGWYLALNRAKLPAGWTKERTVEEFRAALEHHGVATSPWWDRQLGLCLLGALVEFGWEKALGDDDELGWWCAAAAGGAALL